MIHKYWADRSQPSELKGKIISDNQTYYEISSFLLGRVTRLGTWKFKEKCIEMSLDIPDELIEQARSLCRPIVFDPSKRNNKFTIKNYHKLKE